MTTENKEPLTPLQASAVRAAVIARNAHLREINLRRMEVELVAEPGEGEIPIDIDSDYSQEHALKRPEKGAVALSIRVHFEVSVRAEKQVLLRMRCTFQLEYMLNQGMPEGAESDLSAFTATNSMVHVWPYYRELVQSTTWRMGLPPFPLPLFKLSGREGSPKAKRQR